jgi:hypothetical protein
MNLRRLVVMHLAAAVDAVPDELLVLLQDVLVVHGIKGRAFAQQRAEPGAHLAEYAGRVVARRFAHSVNRDQCDLGHGDLLPDQEPFVRNGLISEADS